MAEVRVYEDRAQVGFVDTYSRTAQYTGSSDLLEREFARIDRGEVVVTATEPPADGGGPQRALGQGLRAMQVDKQPLERQVLGFLAGEDNIQVEVVNPESDLGQTLMEDGEATTTAGFTLEAHNDGTSERE